jgi:D-lactate dehydrogenase
MASVATEAPNHETNPNANVEFLQALRAIVGNRHVLTRASATRRYRTGFRFGNGPALAVVRPGSLVEQWKVLEACVAAGKIVIMQASNTGLTGGSTPDGADYDREIVIISARRIAKVRVIDQGRQVVCFPGTTLYQLENTLRPLGREPHSVIGSSCIGASVLGGISNNSGGALIHRGPAFTQMALFARVSDEGRIELINHLGITLGEDAPTILDRLDRGDFTDADVEHDPGRAGSDHDYVRHVRDIEADTPGRFNADPTRLFEASGSAGKVMIFAVRLDTFPHERETATFYIGTNDPTELTSIRRHILAKFSAPPVQGEYLHRVAFDIAERYGKDTFLAIQILGTRWLPALFGVKAWFDALNAQLSFLPRDLSDKIMQFGSQLFPKHLPRRMREYRDKYEHHLLLKMEGATVAEARDYLKSLFPSKGGDFFVCTVSEGEKAFLHRFAAAGAAIRYRAIHRNEVEDIVALDVALRRNDLDWFERLPADLSAPMLHKLYYGHFFCHVFHQDYIIAMGHDTLDIEHKMWALLDARGAQYPAEHNVGHLYVAKPSLVNHYRNLDPCNCFNPGIGRTSKLLRWGELRNDGVRLQCDDVEVSDRPAARSVEAGTRGGLGPCRPI